MSAMHPFSPNLATVTLSVTTSSATTALGAGTGGAGGIKVRVCSVGSATAFLQFGDSTVTASVLTSIPITSGDIEVFTFGPNVTHVAAITGASTATVYVTPGHGY